MSVFVDSLRDSVLITIFVFCMMLLIDYLKVIFRNRLNWYFGSRLRQYITTSFIAVLPGCVGPFFNVSMYVKGVISFGAIVGTMIATSGDEAFVMLSRFPKEAMFLFFILFVVGVVVAWLSDFVISKTKIQTSKKCEHCDEENTHVEKECFSFSLAQTMKSLKNITFLRASLVSWVALLFVLVVLGVTGSVEWDFEKITMVGLIFMSFVIILSVPDHFLNEHIWEHIIKKHIPKIFMATFVAIFLTNYFLAYANIESLIVNNMFVVLILAAVIGIIPQSGPHMVIVMLFANGTVPFSVLLTSSIVQDGHGSLPLLAHSIKDTLLVKAINVIVGLVLGVTLLSFGL